MIITFLLLAYQNIFKTYIHSSVKKIFQSQKVNSPFPAAQQFMYSPFQTYGQPHHQGPMVIKIQQPKVIYPNQPQQPIYHHPNMYQNQAHINQQQPIPIQTHIPIQSQPQPQPQKVTNKITISNNNNNNTSRGKGSALGDSATVCKYCRKETPNEIKPKVGKAVILWASFLCVTGIFCVVPFLVDSCKDKNIKCQECGFSKIVIETDIC